MRAYFFVNNLYIRELQWGLQSLHCLGELHNKYLPDSGEAYETLRDWEQNYKTVIFYGAGNAAGLNDVYNKFCDIDKFNGLLYPFAKFHEDEESLGGCITSVGIVLPAKVYELSRLAREAKCDAAQYLRENGTIGTWSASYTTEEGIIEVFRVDVVLADLLNEYRLA